MNEALFPIEQEIVSGLNQEAERLYEMAATRKEWTATFKKTLRKLGKERGYEVWAKFDDEPNSGWLWDLCWARCDKAHPLQTLSHIALACEIEWTTGDDYLLEDFLKLTVCDAGFRVFIFTWQERTGKHCFRLLMNACPPSRGYRYLAIGVPEHKMDELPCCAWTL